jgi:hypothetical protein
LVTNGCDFNHLRAAQFGGFIYGANLAEVSISTCNLQNITSGMGGSFIQSITPGFKFGISSCNVKCSSVALDPPASVTISNMFSMFEIKNALQVTSANNNFENC